MGESAIGIALTLRDLIIILGYDTTQWWGIPFRVAEDEGSIAGINF